MQAYQIIEKVKDLLEEIPVNDSSVEEFLIEWLKGSEGYQEIKEEYEDKIEDLERDIENLEVAW